MAAGQLKKLLFCVAFLVALSPFQAAGTAALSPGSAAYEPPRTREAFEQAFRVAFASGELTETLRLFDWEEMQRSHRNIIYELIAQDLAKTLVNLSWLPVRDPAQGDENGDRSVQSNLPVLARLAADFVDERGLASRSVHDIGQHQGVFYIVLFEPILRSAAGPPDHWFEPHSPSDHPRVRL